MSRATITLRIEVEYDCDKHGEDAEYLVQKMAEKLQAMPTTMEVWETDLEGGVDVQLTPVPKPEGKTIDQILAALATLPPEERAKVEVAMRALVKKP